MFFSLELRGALIADAASEFTFGTYRTLRFVTTGMAAVVLLSVGVWEYVGERNAAFTIILLGMCASKVVLSLAEIGWGLYQKRERLDLMAASACLRGVTMIVAFAVLVPLCYYLAQRGVIEPARIAQGAAMAILTYALASLVILLTFDRRVLAARHDFDPAWTWDAVGRLARQTFPLGVVLVTLHLCNSVPQLVIERQADGKAALGHFGALATLTLVGNLLTFQAANAAANRLSSYFQFDLPRVRSGSAGKLIAMAPPPPPPPPPPRPPHPPPPPPRPWGSDSADHAALRRVAVARAVPRRVRGLPRRVQDHRDRAVSGAVDERVWRARHANAACSGYRFRPR